MMFGLTCFCPSLLLGLHALALSFGAQGESGSTPQGGSPEPSPCCDAAGLLAEAQTRSAHLEAELDRAQERIQKLEAELAEANEERLAREKEWFSYTQAVALLTPEDLTLPADASFAVDQELARQAEAERAAEAARLAEIQERSARMLRRLRSLFLKEGVAGLDLLDTGIVEDGFTGPVILRVLDELRRPIGTMRAERLRLEGSLAGHTLTIVLEEGWEKHGGIRVPFDLLDGDEVATRRFILPHVDPAPWMRELPELFSLDAVEAQYETSWNTTRIRREFNQLLREDASGGFYRLRAFGGVLHGEMRDVHLEVLDREGRLGKRLFADRMRIVKLDRGVSLVLESGVQISGTEKSPFLGGRYRIFLPRARVDAWAAAGLPGLVQAPTAVESEGSQ